MKQLLYIGHTYHNKTKSTQFLKDILSEEYQITYFNFDPYTDNYEKFKELNGSRYDVVVLFQIMPSINALKKYMQFNKGVFFPMYDYYEGLGRLETPLWEEYKDFQIICFAKKMHDDLKAVGFSSKYIQYFPKPLKVTNMGDEHSCFLWQRVSCINIQTVQRVFKKFKLSHIHVHKATDPGHQFVEAPADLKKIVSYSLWYGKKEEMQKDIQKSAFYMAPRVHEGIGMSFLEAMALGRCVIAPNEPTMNEYIQNGKTGFLYEMKDVRALEINNVRKIQENTLSYMKKGYQVWEKEKRNILKWLQEEPVININRLNNYLLRAKEGYGHCRVLLFGFCVFETYKTPTKYTLFFFKMPFLKIKTKFDGSKKFYYLFGTLPILTMKKKDF